MFSFNNLFKSLLIGLIVGGLFSATLYAFATYGVDEYYPLGNTLTPTCTPGDEFCKVVSPAFFSFGSNNFSGTGSFTTTNIITGGTLKVGDVYTLPTSDGTNGQALVTDGAGVVSWSTISTSGFVPYTGANTTVNLGSQALTTTGTIGGGAITGTSFIIGANTISSFANLSSLAGLATTVGLVKQTSANTFGIDATAYYKSGDSATFANITDSALTSGRVPYASTAGLLADSASLTFDGNTLNITSTSAAQAKLTNDSSNYATLTTGSTGDLTIATATGTTGGDIILNPASSANNSMLSASGLLVLGGYGGTYDENLKFDFETTENTVGLSSTTGATSINFGSLNLATAGTLTLGGSTAGTLVTRVKAGAPDESDANGSVVIDSSDARIYFRYGGAWHYAAQTAGFQIPDFETIDPISGDQIAEGDIVLGMINQTMSDNALHGVWVKWDSVKADLLAEARGELSQTGTWGEGSISGVKTETLLDKVTNVLFSLGISVKDGITSIKQLVSEKITTNTLEIKQMQMVDKATGEIYCAWIENGNLVNVKGECSSVDVAVALAEQNQQQQEITQQVVQNTTQEVVQQASEQIQQQIQEQVQEVVQQQVGEQVQQQIQEEVSNQIQQQQEEQTIEEPATEEIQPVVEEPIVETPPTEPVQIPEGNEEGEEAPATENLEQPVEELAPIEEAQPIIEPAQSPEGNEEGEEAPSIGDVVQESTAGLLNSMSKFFKDTFILGLKKISNLPFIKKISNEAKIGLTITTPMLIEKSSASLSDSFEEISSAFQDLWEKIEKLKKINN
jgi:hypothetical protein